MRSTGPTSDPPQIGRYQVIRHLATGGMAQIYLARMDGMASFERHVVLKTILATRANDRRFINMFLDEAKLAATLNHQNIAQVYEVDQADGAYYMAMEYVHGENCRAILETSIRRGQQIPLELAILIVSGAAAGLHHAHERKGKSGQALNIVHRDVSPANIMVGYDGSVKVLDFGIAKAEERYTQTVGSTIKGKYGYMSPEQCKGKPVDRRSDIFALGIVLYELTTQRRAFKGRDDFDTMKRIVASDLVLPTSLLPSYPPQLEDVILKALSTDPQERFATAQDMIEALDVFTQREKLTCTNTAMARYMVQLFGEPREPWETVPVEARRASPSSPSLDSGEEFTGQDDLRTTVLAGGSTTLPPSSSLIPPRTITTPMVRTRNAAPTTPARPRSPSVSGGRVQEPTVPTAPPMRAAAPTTPPAMASGQPAVRRPLNPSAPPVKSADPSNVPSLPPATVPMPIAVPRARTTLAAPSFREDHPAPTPAHVAASRAPAPALSGAPLAAPRSAAASASSQAEPSSPSPQMRLTPGPLSIPLVPRTFTPSISQPMLVPLPARSVLGGDGLDGRVPSEEGPGRVLSSVMAPLPNPESLAAAMAPLPRPDTAAPEPGPPPIKHRWVIVAVLFVVLAAVGLMIAIALTSGPTP